MTRNLLKCECGHTSDRHIARHIRTCTARPFALRVNELAAENANLKEELRGNAEEIERLTKENAELKSRSTTTINNYNVINVVAYGQETLPTKQDVLRILRPPEGSVARYIEMKHFRNPETSNMRIQNKRSRTMQIVEEDARKRLRWTEKDRKRMIEKLVEDNLEELTETHGAEQVAIWKYWYHRSGLANPGYDKTDAWKRIQEDVENMLMSQRDYNVVE